MKNVLIIGGLVFFVGVTILMSRFWNGNYYPDEQDPGKQAGQQKTVGGNKKKDL